MLQFKKKIKFFFSFFFLYIIKIFKEKIIINNVNVTKKNLSYL